MSGAPIQPRRDRDRIAILERKVITLEDELGRWRRAAAVWPTQPVLAKTTTSGTYPTAPSNTYEIVFCNGTYTESDGVQTPTLTARKSTPQRFAHALGGEYYPEGAYVFVARIDRKYWIVGGAPIARRIDFVLTAALTTSDATVAADVDAYYDGSSPGASITLRNKSADTGYIFEGSSGEKGEASWDDLAGYYKIWQMQC